MLFLLLSSIAPTFGCSRLESAILRIRGLDVITSIPQESAARALFVEASNWHQPMPGSWPDADDQLRHPAAGFHSVRFIESAVKGLKPEEEFKEKDRLEEPEVKLLSSFVHLSDAQINDEKLTLEKETIRTRQRIENTEEVLDRFIPVARRRSIVEALDEIVYASFLRGCLEEVRKIGSSDRKTELSFIVNTGDLLDLSLSTELIAATDVQSRILGIDAGRPRLMPVIDRTNAERQISWRLNQGTDGRTRLPLLQLAGNHDGLIRGNLDDKRTDTRSLGVNCAEFVLGHIVADMKEGFGFMGNEIIQAGRARRAGSVEKEEMFEEERKPGVFTKQEWKDISELYEEIEKFFENATSGCGPGGVDIEEMRAPARYRRVVDVSRDADDSPLSTGYYSVSEDLRDNAANGNVRNETVNGVFGVRHIMLDTRSKSSAYGKIDDVQLMWLVKEMEASIVQCQAVILYAHHGLDDFEPRNNVILGMGFGTSRSATILKRIIATYPNIVAFFYGHGHRNEQVAGDGGIGSWRRVPRFQTGSITDYPQVARLVELGLETAESEGRYRAHIKWEFVRPETHMWECVRPETRMDVENGRRLDALLEASRKDAEKEKEQNDGELIKPSRFRREHLRPGCFIVDFATGPCVLDAAFRQKRIDEIFGRRHAREIMQGRKALGLP